MLDDEYKTLSGSPRRSFFQRFKYPIIATVVILVTVVIVLAVVFSARAKKDNKAWEGVISTSDIMGHMQDLQNIANANDGTRAASTSGYNASVDYIVNQLHAHGYVATVEDFTYSNIVTNSVSNLTIFTSQETFELVYNTDFSVLGGDSGFVDINNISVTVANGYGCSLSDYDNVLANTVALVKRGNCSFIDKAKIAAQKLPYAIVIYNEGNAPDRKGPLDPNISVGQISCPVFGTSYYSGLAMIGASISVSVDFTLVTKYTKNVVTETKNGRADSVVVIGSHLDSVPAGPGINDNGSGSSLNLALAILISKDDHEKKLENKIRFCWFGAEELGLLGSEFYVSNLNKTNPAELANIAVMLNFDMIGSPNFMRGVYNGSSDENSKGSGVVQDLFNSFYAKEKITVIPTEFSGRSDYRDFLNAGIPSGGLFTGAEVVKSMEERKLFGGLAGASYDPCYHKACDTIDNIDVGVVTDMARGAAHVLETLSTHKELRDLLHHPL